MDDASCWCECKRMRLHCVLQQHRVQSFSEDTHWRRGRPRRRNWEPPGFHFPAVGFGFALLPRARLAPNRSEWRAREPASKPIHSLLSSAPPARQAATRLLLMPPPVLRLVPSAACAAPPRPRAGVGRTGAAGAGRARLHLRAGAAAGEAAPASSRTQVSRGGGGPNALPSRRLKCSKKMVFWWKRCQQKS
jgi:hypothetical protein